MSKTKKLQTAPAKNCFSALVISDIHAVDGDPTSTDTRSYVSARNVSAESITDPIERLIATVKARRPSVELDCLICPGDLADRANPTALSYVWRRIQDVAKELGNIPVIATPGNHDLDSRYMGSSYDARGQIMGVVPTLPFDNRDSYLEFWAENFTVLTLSGARIVAVNSAAYHGSGVSQEAEYERGRINPRTVEKLEQVLSSGGKSPFNILVCHHHLVRRNEVHEKDYSEMAGADKLLDLLGNGRHGSWLVIHGHKHRPRVTYAEGGGSSPVLLCAASLSFNVGLDATNKSPNQFHIVQINNSRAELIEQGIAGEIESWEWEGRDWRPASSKGNIPYKAGFGFRGSIDHLAVRIASYFADKDLNDMDWNQLLEVVPAISHLLPQELKVLRDVLSSDHSINVLDRDDTPAQIGRTFSGANNEYKTST